MSTASDQRARHIRSRGFSLIEALVATVVFSVGLIGLGMLQTKGLQFSRNAYIRTQATVLARELADRMRANTEATDSGLYAFSASTLSPPVATEPSDCGSEDCGPADLAGYDLSDWWSKIQSELPSASVTVVQTGPGGYQITLFWDDTGTPTGTPSCPSDNVSGSSGWQCYRLQYVP